MVNVSVYRARGLGLKLVGRNLVHAATGSSLFPGPVGFGGICMIDGYDVDPVMFVVGREITAAKLDRFEAHQFKCKGRVVFSRAVIQEYSDAQDTEAQYDERVRLSMEQQAVLRAEAKALAAERVAEFA